MPINKIFLPQIVVSLYCGVFLNQGIWGPDPYEYLEFSRPEYWLMDYTVHGILQARILEWVAFPFSKGSS